MSESNATEYLKGAVGDLLAKGVAQTVETKPSDPVEYLALWLLHEQQRLNVIEPKRAEDRKTLEEDREVFKKQQEEEAAEAARIIQAQMKIALAQRAAAVEAEKKLLKEYEAEKETFEEDFEEEYEEEGGEGAGEEEGGDEEAPAEGGENDERKKEAIQTLEMEKARIKMIAGYLKKVDAKQLKDVRNFKKPVPEKGTIHYNIVKAILLIKDTKYKNLKTWNDMKRTLPKAGDDILALITNYNPAKKTKKPIKFKRAKRFLRYLDEEEVKKRGLLLYLLMDWIDACLKANTALNAAAPFLPAEEEEEAEEDEEEDDDPYGATPSEAEWVDPDIAAEQEGEGEGGKEEEEGEQGDDDE